MGINILLEPLQYSFMQRAIIELILIGSLTSIIGVFLVLRNLAFLGEALSHGVFPGIILSFLLKVNLLVGAVVSGIITIIGISLISKDRKTSANTATGILFTTMLALGIVLISTVRNYKADLTSLLLGDILAVTWNDIALTLIVSVIVIATLRLLWKKLIIVSFDPSFASSIGINVARLDMILYFLISLSIVVAIPAVGNLLVVALSIIPAATARLSTNRIGPMVILSVIYGTLISVIALYLTYYLQVATGATIVLLQAGWFLVVFSLKRLGKSA